jgi:predicted site-specific integrase-resolvase
MVPLRGPNVSTSDLLTPREVARIFGVSVQTLAVWRCEQRYALPYLKVGSLVRYRQADVDRFLDTRVETPVAS